jgi:hypothetical protein
MRHHIPHAAYPNPMRATLKDSYLALLQVGFTMPWNVATHAVRSYRTISPLPVLSKLKAGGIFSVALSVGSRPPGITWHFALWSPDFPPPLRKETAAAQPTRGRR